ncbi:MAG TPA: hypothetical protein VNZ86_09555 [Bacteroidia bacterium]|jgi:hypothetical protein|nr:hypothetical protein [Bacteroidia bacterium]
MKTITIWYLLFSLSAPVLLRSQTAPESVTGKKIKHTLNGFYMTGGAGYASLSPSSTTSISTNLMNNGFAPMTSDMVSWSMSPLKLLVRNTVFELEVTGMAQRNSVYNDSRTTTSGFGTKMALGYVVYHTDHVLIYPQAGIYLGNMDVHSHQGNSPVLDVSATNHATALDFSLNIDRISSLITDKSSFSKGTLPMGKLFSGLVGISVGYSFSPYYSFWNDNNIDIYNKVSNNVNFLTNVVGENTASSLSVFYIKLRFGFGVCWKN